MFGGRQIAGLLLEKLPLAIASIVVSGLTLQAEGETNALRHQAGYGLQARLANLVVTYTQYLADMVWPYHLAAFYPRQIWPAWEIVACTVLLLLVSGAVIRLRRTRPYLIIGWLWYAGALVPMSGLVAVGFFSRADRFTYFPMIGLLIALVWLVPETWGATAGRRAMIGGGVAAVVAFWGVLTAFQTQTWQNSFALFSHALDATGDANWQAHESLGFYYSSQHNYPLALTHLSRAVELFPTYEDAQFNLANCLRTLGRPMAAGGRLFREGGKRGSD
jgi:hypothetical protein